MTKREEIREANRAAERVWVNCVGCGRWMKGQGITCSRCRFKPHTYLKEST